MSFEAALRLVEIGVAWALILRALEHVRSDGLLFILQLFVAAVLLLGVARAMPVWGLWALCVWQLHRFQGAYNGGADKMALLCLTCLSLAHLFEGTRWSELALAYLAVQLVLSYVVSGWVKVCNRDWRSGQALADVFAFSAYPVAENFRALAGRPRLLWWATWAVIGLELAFPLALLHPAVLALALLAAAGFHLSNALFLGLNRFFWIWISAYPALIWFQGRIGLG